MNPGVGVDELRAVLAAAGARDVDPDALACEQLVVDAVASATVRIWRYSHHGWSVVLKVLQSQAGNNVNWQSGEDEGHWYYWRREALAYSSGLLDHLPGSLRAPECFGVFNRPDSSVGLWLEDLRPAIPTPSWSVGDYRSAAVALGHAEGAISAAARLPAEPWLARHWLRDYVERRRGYLVHLDNPKAWRLPLVSRHLQSALAQEMKGVFDERERLLAVVESGTQTLCHLDLHPGNLFAVDGDTVLIDWAFVGLGALGEDAGNLMVDSVLDFFVSPDDFVGLADAVSIGYLEGLEASGWRGDTDVVLRTMRAGAAVKFFWILPAMLDAATSGRDALNGRPIDEAFAAWAPIVAQVAEFSRRV